MAARQDDENDNDGRRGRAAAALRRGARAHPLGL